MANGLLVICMSIVTNIKGKQCFPIHSSWVAIILLLLLLYYIAITVKGLRFSLYKNKSMLPKYILKAYFLIDYSEEKERKSFQDLI